MSDPTIPALSLANDHSEMGIDTQDTYGLHLEIKTPEDWVYEPEGRFPKYDAQILITIRAAADKDALCTRSAADEIHFIQQPRQLISDGKHDDDSKTYSRTVTIDPGDNHVVISKAAPLTIEMKNIAPNGVEGDADIILLPRLKAKHADVQDIKGEPLRYTVTKAAPPVVIGNVAWSPNKPGAGILTWQVTGSVEECTLQANGEPIGASSYRGENSQYKADLILEMGTGYVTITAADANQNTATVEKTFEFRAFNPYFVLQVSNGRPLSLVQSDQTSCLYGVFANDQDGIQIWKNTRSGTQDNWQKTGLRLVAGYETSPCVHYNSQFYLLGGSRFDFDKFQNGFWTYESNVWQPLTGPDGWKVEPRIGQSVALFNQAIWVAGGYGASGAVYDDVYSYSADGWKPQPSLPQRLCNASLAVVGGKLYLFGGYSRGPGSSASTQLYRLSDDGNSWVDQAKTPPPGAADYWALGSLGGELRLLASFGGRAFTGHATASPDWQGGDQNFSSVVMGLGQDTPPYAFTAVQYNAPQFNRLFLVIASSEGRSVLAYYELLSSAVGRA